MKQFGIALYVLAFVLTGMLALQGCTMPNSQDEIIQNQCIYEQAFKECSAVVPKGPTSTTYNDWDEVVSQCRTHARSASYRPRGTIPLQCVGYR